MPSQPGDTTDPFREQDGQVVIEAESATGNVARGGQAWVARTDRAGYAGSSFLADEPDTSTIINTGYATTSPELQYQIQFATAGTYQVWLRGFATNGSNDSVHVGLDGQAVASASRMTLLTYNAWTWFKGTMDGPVATLVVPSAGLHTVNIWVREDGFRLDRLLLTTEANFTPSGSGPAESLRGGNTTDPGPSTPTPTPTAMTTPPPAGSTPKLLFGIGTEAPDARDTRLTNEAPVQVLTSWYNRPEDLSWMTRWRTNLVPTAYSEGYALHLVVYSHDPEGTLQTPYGSACGRAYPLSSGFVSDMEQLARTFAGSGPLYVTLFTEFQTYPCQDNQWAGNDTYYRALKDQYRAARAIFRQHAPNARISLGWGGWQTRWDNPATGAGQSMVGYFADVMQESDFQSFQAMSSQSNVADVRAMTRTLGAFGPVMLAHYKPDNGSQATFDADVRAMLTDSYLAELTAAGLFAWSFMDHNNLSASETTYQFVKEAVIRHAR